MRLRSLGPGAKTKPLLLEGGTEGVALALLLCWLVIVALAEIELELLPSLVSMPSCLIGSASLGFLLEEPCCAFTCKGARGVHMNPMALWVGQVIHGMLQAQRHLRVLLLLWQSLQ